MDGTQYNDLFGLGASGTPGGTAGTSPVSLDVIQEFQVVVAPYDVRMSGFTGGGINAITRSGTNDYSGSAYYYGRSESFVGVSPTAARTKLNAFSESLTGFRIGGPVSKDRLFFFASGELARRTEPVTNTTLESVTGIREAADQIKSILISKYGYDPGSYDSFDALRPSAKIFLRFDYNLSDAHKLTARFNYVDANQDNTGRFSNQLGFSDRVYKLNNKTFAPVVQLTSTFGNTMSNELILGFTSIRDHRIPASTAFPSVRINFDANNNIRAGGDEFSQANQLDQDIFEFTNNFSMYMGEHIFTFGTHNEFFRFSNLYIANQTGYYEFATPADFLAGKISLYNYSYAYNGDNALAAKFNAVQLGGYVQDEWTASSTLKATIGLRIDVPVFPDKPSYNAKIDSMFSPLGLGTNKVPSGMLLFSPRIGLNWNVNGDRSLQIRGGAGLFTGRIPYVWISNQYGNTGVEFGRVSASNPTFQLEADPNNQPRPGKTTVLSPVKTTEVDLTDADFKMPQILRFNAAIDHALLYGLTGTLEAIYSRSINDITYQDLNLVPAASQVNPRYTGVRILMTKRDATNFTNIVLMKNTDRGYTYNLTAQVQGTLPFGLFTNLAYTYTRSKDLNSVVASQAYSQYRYNPVQTNPNEPTLATSNFEIRGRLMFAVSYSFKYFTNFSTTVAMFYNGQSGRPYSYTYNGNINGDGASTNDLLYIPVAGEVQAMKMGTTKTTSSKTYFVADPAMNANFEDFINADSYLSSHRGQIMERNALREPFVHMLDMKLTQEVPVIAGHRVEVSLDILNVLNLLSRNWGWVNTVSSQNASILTYTKTTGDAVDVFKFIKAKDVNGNPKNDFYAPDDIASRFQMQLGVRYSF
ncbi:MAG: hypothetical protein WCJ01_10070 [Ignavibacteria bacterium]